MHLIIWMELKAQNCLSFLRDCHCAGTCFERVQADTLVSLCFQTAAIYLQKALRVGSPSSEPIREA